MRLNRRNLRCSEGCGAWFARLLCLSDVFGLETFRSLFQLELDAVTFIEGAVAALIDDGGVVDKNVLSAITCDETKSLVVVEPFHYTNF